MKLVSLAVAVFAFLGCRAQGLKFVCQTDAQCGPGGTCINNGCAFAADCPSGYRWDNSAPSGAGQCVPTAMDDMATGGGSGDDLAPTAVADLAMPAPPDMAIPIDMTITCAMQGQPCTVGVGACARTGTVMCTAPSMATCSATAGAPDTSGTWHQAAAANGSWDWDCDGATEYRYPSSDTTPPPTTEMIGSGNSCMDAASQSICNADHYYYIYSANWAISCGHPVEDQICNWGSNFCNQITTQEVTQGCH